MQNIAEHQMETALITPQVPVGEEERVDAIFNNIQQHIGFVPDALRLYSISPPLLETFVGNVGYFNMGGTQLPPVLTAMIRYLGSWQASCSYCVDLNEGFLSNLGIDLDVIRSARDNPDMAPLEEKDKTLLKLALKAVTSPDEVNSADIDNARQQGWGDREIFDAVAQAANNRALNYILRTFNVEHEGAFT